MQYQGLKRFTCINLCMKCTVLSIFFISPVYGILVLLLVIASDVINVTLVITNEDCTDGEYNQPWEKLSKMVTNLFV